MVEHKSYITHLRLSGCLNYHHLSRSMYYVCDPIFIKNNIEELSFRPYFKVSDLHELLIAVDVGLFEPLLQKFDFFKNESYFGLTDYFLALVKLRTNQFIPSLRHKGTNRLCHKWTDMRTPCPSLKYFVA